MRPSLRIIGIGNELRRDDAVGLHVARRLASRNPARAEVLTSDGDPADLEEKWCDAEQVFVVDASVSAFAPGTIRTFQAHERRLPADNFASSSHAFGLADSIELSRAMGTLPPELVVITIEAADVGHGAELTSAVAAAAERVVAELEALLPSVRKSNRAPVTCPWGESPVIERAHPGKAPGPSSVATPEPCGLPYARTSPSKHWHNHCSPAEKRRPGMKKMLERMKRQIERELERVNREVEALKKEPRAEELEGFGDNTPLSEEVDAVAVAEQKELDSDRLGRLLDRASALDEALHRIHEGTYGVCVSCGAKISEERLMAVPEALYCMRCQEQAETRSRREVHAHEWKLAEEDFRERQKSEEGEPRALFGSSSSSKE